MDARQLRYFLAVVDQGGINRAAETLLIAQPSLSQSISALERELGVPLFHRVGRRLVLSDAGETLVGPARVVLRDLEDAKASVDALKELRAGRVDLITMPSPGIEPLTTILTSFSRTYPSVTVNAEAAFTPKRCSMPCAPASARSGSWVHPLRCVPPNSTSSHSKASR